MEVEGRKDLREYAWNYFSLHADQRLRAFHFYVLLSAVIVGALLTVIKEAQDPRLGCPLAFGLAFLSFVFWKLDLRNKELVRHGEEALKSLETDALPTGETGALHPLAIFLREETATQGRRRGLRAFLVGPLSYSESFNLVFAVFGVSGLVTGFGLLIACQ